MPRPVPPKRRWTDRHRVVSFYASAELITWIEEEMRRSARSKTQVIVAALDKERQPKTPVIPAPPVTAATDGKLTRRSRAWLTAPRGRFPEVVSPGGDG